MHSAGSSTRQACVQQDRRLTCNAYPVGEVLPQTAGCWGGLLSMVLLCVCVLQEDDGEQVLLTYKLTRVRMLIISSWLWVTALHRKLFCACGCLSSYCSCFLLRSALLLRWSKCVFKTERRKARGDERVDGARASRLWTAALGPCFNSGLLQWFPGVLMNPPAHQSSLQGAQGWLLIQTVSAVGLPRALELKESWEFRALPCSSVFVTALQLVGASSKCCPHWKYSPRV